MNLRAELITDFQFPVDEFTSGYGRVTAGIENDSWWVQFPEINSFPRRAELHGGTELIHRFTDASNAAVRSLTRVREPMEDHR